MLGSLVLVVGIEEKVTGREPIEENSTQSILYENGLDVSDKYFNCWIWAQCDFEKSLFYAAFFALTDKVVCVFRSDHFHGSSTRRTEQAKMIDFSFKFHL